MASSTPVFWSHSFDRTELHDSHKKVQEGPDNPPSPQDGRRRQHIAGVSMLSASRQLPQVVLMLYSVDAAQRNP
eukprot:5992342-Pyramimonas_sp.AAC.1